MKCGNHHTEDDTVERGVWDPKGDRKGLCWRGEALVSFSTVSKKGSLETDSENQLVLLRRPVSSFHSSLPRSRKQILKRESSDFSPQQSQTWDQPWWFTPVIRKKTGQPTWAIEGDPVSTKHNKTKPKPKRWLLQEAQWATSSVSTIQRTHKADTRNQQGHFCSIGWWEHQLPQPFWKTSHSPNSPSRFTTLHTLSPL